MLLSLRLSLARLLLVCICGLLHRELAISGDAPGDEGESPETGDSPSISVVLSKPVRWSKATARAARRQVHSRRARLQARRAQREATLHQELASVVSQIETHWRAFGRQLNASDGQPPSAPAPQRQASDDRPAWAEEAIALNRQSALASGVTEEDSADSPHVSTEEPPRVASADADEDESAHAPAPDKRTPRGARSLLSLVPKLRRNTRARKSRLDTSPTANLAMDQHTPMTGNSTEANATTATPLTAADVMQRPVIDDTVCRERRAVDERRQAAEVRVLVDDQRDVRRQSVAQKRHAVEPALQDAWPPLPDHDDTPESAQTKVSAGNWPALPIFDPTHDGSEPDVALAAKNSAHLVELAREQRGVPWNA